MVGITQITGVDPDVEEEIELVGHGYAWGEFTEYLDDLTEHPKTKHLSFEARVTAALALAHTSTTIQSSLRQAYYAFLARRTPDKP